MRLTICAGDYLYRDVEWQAIPRRDDLIMLEDVTDADGEHPLAEVVGVTWGMDGVPVVDVYPGDEITDKLEASGEWRKDDPHTVYRLGPNASVTSDPPGHGCGCRECGGCCDEDVATMLANAGAGAPRC